MNGQGNRYEFATIEWLWQSESIRVNLPGNQETKQSGSYNEVVTVLNQLGAQGWSVVGSVAVSNWLFWTLQRPQP